MIVPNGLVLVTLLAAFILSGLSFWKLNPAHILSQPFAVMALPLALFLTYLGLVIGGAMPSPWSVLYMLVALATLALAVWQARCFRPKPR